jgi:UDP-2,3-diacylglucosamine hydrolase
MPLNRDKVSAYFVSDLHLTTLSDKRGQFFLSWLKNLGPHNCTHLFLLGDIFDLWLGRHLYFVKTYHLLLNELVRLKHAGVAIHYFEGNHDLYLESYFGESLGIIVHSSPAEFLMCGLKLRVEHGDQMDPEDKGYLFLRWLLRTPVVKTLVSILPNWTVVDIGQRMSTASRRYTSEVKVVSRDRAIEKMRSHARYVLNGQTQMSSDYDLLVHGHTHVMDDFVFSHNGRQRRAINLGSWITEAYCLHVTNEKQVLQKIFPVD